MKPVYFLSDAHLGSKAIGNDRIRERMLVHFLDSIKDNASAIYFVGDIFDFWWEYKTVVPKGFTRFLGKLSELTDHGVEVHFFTGNHDIWCKGYLEEECGVIMHYEDLTTVIMGKTFYISHGDGMERTDKKYMILRTMFHSRLLQYLFSLIHPSWGVSLGLAWAKQSRLMHEGGQEPEYKGEDKEPLVLFAKSYLKSHPDINHFIFGHRHIELDLMLSKSARLTILGDWIRLYTYAIYDGERFFLENYSDTQ